MNPVTKYLCLLPIVMAAAPLQASSVTGTISSFSQRASDGLAILIINGTPTARPGCSPHYSYYMIKDENSRAGQTQIAQILSAQLAGKSVTVEGAGTSME